MFTFFLLPFHIPFSFSLSLSLSLLPLSVDVTVCFSGEEEDSSSPPRELGEEEGCPDWEGEGGKSGRPSFSQRINGLPGSRPGNIKFIF